MKKDVVLIGIICLGVSMIICSLILSKAIKEQRQSYGTLNNQLSGSIEGRLYLEEDDSANQMIIESDILVPYQVGELLGYSDYNLLIIDIEDGKLEGIPYTRIRSNYVFSKKALEDWIYSKVVN
jgi:hypothetical protein